MNDLILKKLKRLPTSRAVWSMGDQGMVSIGNFAVNIILARNVSLTDYGIYTLAVSVFFFLSRFHGSIVGYPVTLMIAREGASGAPRLVGLAVRLSCFLLPLLTLVIAGLFIMLERPALIPWAAAAFVAWRFQEVFRRSLMAQLKYRVVVYGDAISYLGQAVAMLCLVYFDLLSLETVFLAMAGTSALAAVVQAIQVRVKLTFSSPLFQFAKECWDLGRWVIMQRIIGVAQGQGIGWTLAAVYGVEATASYRAAVNILAVTHPVMQGISNLVTPSIAHAHKVSLAKVKRVGWKLCWQGAILVFPYFFVLAFMPDFTLDLIYGADSPYSDLGHIVVIMTVGYALSYLVKIVMGVIAGMGKPAVAFHAQIYGTTSAFLIAIPLAAWGGIDFAAIGKSISGFIVLCASLVLLRRVFLREVSAGAAKRPAGDAE